MSLVFWLMVAAMLGVALVFLLPSLLRGSGELLDSTAQQNLSLARERLAELEQDRAAGRLSDAAYQEARQELEQQLAADLSLQSKTRLTQGNSRGLVAALALLLPLISIVLYQYLGEPDLLTEQSQQQASMPTGHAGMGDSSGLPSVDSMVAGLAARLEQQPDDPQGWYMLARSYMSLDRYVDAVQAYERLLGLVGDDPEIMVSYADALAMTRNGDMSGRPLAMIEKALALEPSHPTGLWLAGMAYRQLGRYQDAISAWQKARSVLTTDPASVAELDNLIANTKKQVGDVALSPREEAEALPEIVTARIEVSVSLDETLRDRVAPEDTVFILARAINGPPMPLAVVRKQVRDLPVTVTLDDSQAMMPAMKLSRFEEVSVLARVSRSGNPVAQSGDLEGMLASVSPLKHPVVTLKIDSSIP